MNSLPFKTFVKTLGLHKPFALLLISTAYIIPMGAYSQRIQAQELISQTAPKAPPRPPRPAPEEEEEKTYTPLRYYNFGSTDELTELRIIADPPAAVELAHTLAFPASDLFPEGLLFTIQHNLLVTRMVHGSSNTILRTDKVPYKLVMKYVYTNLRERVEQLYVYDISALKDILSDHCYEMLNPGYLPSLYRYTPSVSQCSSDPSLDFYNWAKQIWSEILNRPSPPPRPKRGPPQSGPAGYGNCSGYECLGK